MTGAQLIEDERRRQIERGYDAEHDQARHEPTLLVVAHAVLGSHVGNPPFNVISEAAEIHARVTTKHPHDEIRRLQIAGALIAAEIDRVQLRDALARGPRKLSELSS